jgi:hypothetical protein
MYRQGLPALDLYIERDTPRTPRAGRYYLFLQGAIIATSATLKAAQALYLAQKAALGYQPPPPPPPDPRQALVQESQDDYLDRGEAHWATSTRYRARGRPTRR